MPLGEQVLFSLNSCLLQCGAMWTREPPRERLMRCWSTGRVRTPPGCWAGLRTWPWNLSHVLDRKLNLPELIASSICGGRQVLRSSLFLNFLGRCHHGVQRWTHSALLGDQHRRVELGDVPGHGQVGFVFALSLSLCNPGLGRKKGIVDLVWTCIIEKNYLVVRLLQ